MKSISKKPHVYEILFSLYLLFCSVSLFSQSWTPLPKNTTNLEESILFQYDDDNSGTHRLGLGLDFNNTTERPTANFHIWADPLNLTPLKLERIRFGYGGVLESLGIIELGSKKTINDAEYNFGIFQTGSNVNWCNYFQNKVAIGLESPIDQFDNSILSVNGQIGLKECLFFADPGNHRYEIKIENKYFDDQFYFTFTKVDNMGFTTPFSLTSYGLTTRGLLIADNIQLITGAGTNKVLVSDQIGNGIWTDASGLHDDDWIPIVEFGDSPPMNLHLGNHYQKVGIGTQAPKQALHVCGGNILISRRPDDAPGSLNGSIYFGEVVSTEFPNGEWGIEYINDVDYDTKGLNFWKVNTNSGPSGNYRLFLQNDGNVGVGTSDPRSLLDVNGKLSSKDIYVSGKVGIGTTSPQSELAVNGIITAKEIIVTLDGFPDYVFHSGYKLKSLNEVEKYIKQYKHLPETPTEQDVKENGLDLGQMNATLLKKIEELTLYIIELNKEVTKLKSELGMKE